MSRKDNRAMNNTQYQDEDFARSRGRGAPMPRGRGGRGAGARGGYGGPPRQDFSRQGYQQQGLRGPRDDYEPPLDRGYRDSEVPYTTTTSSSSYDDDRAPRGGYDRAPRGGSRYDDDRAPRGGYDRAPRDGYDRAPRGGSRYDDDYDPRDSFMTYDPREDDSSRGGRRPARDDGHRGYREEPEPQEDFVNPDLGVDIDTIIEKLVSKIDSQKEHIRISANSIVLREFPTLSNVEPVFVSEGDDEEVSIRFLDIDDNFVTGDAEINEEFCFVALPTHPRVIEIKRAVAQVRVRYQEDPGSFAPAPPPDEDDEEEQTPLEYAEALTIQSLVDSMKTYYEMIVKGFLAQGFQKPSGTQSMIMAMMMSGRDCLVQRKSGSGKTNAFLGAGLTMINPGLTKLQMVILTNTQENVGQVWKLTSNLMKSVPGITQDNIIMVHGNTPSKRATSDFVGSSKPQRKSDVRQAMILISTIGMFYGLIKDKKIDLSELRVVVVDEFDAMMRPVVSRSRFRNDGTPSDVMIREIFLEHLPSSTIRWFISATLEQSSVYAAGSYFRKGLEPFICISKENDVTLPCIEQYYSVITGANETEVYMAKVRAVLWIIANQTSIRQAILFVNKKDRVAPIAALLCRGGGIHPSAIASYSADLGTAGRAEGLERFREGKVKFLVTTDVMARGVDVQSVNCVINIDAPFDLQTYIHRIGRCGRYGRKGISFIFVCSRETIQDIDALTDDPDNKMKELIMHV